jgi:phosphatidylserine/phosphatidylglycerophosphate/cardiolipin synthase-like enzyme
MDPSFTEKLCALLFGFNRFNQRMHNKTFIVDELIAITGGRNYQNAYFDQARALNYKDRDIIVIGPVVKEISDSFRAYWDFEYSVNLNDLKDVKKLKKHGEVRIWDTRESFQLHGLFPDIDVASKDRIIIEKKFTNNLMEIDEAYFIADDPGKSVDASNGPSKVKSKITLELARLVSTAKESIYLQTPYLILTSPAIDLFDEIRRKYPDIDIRISTNSLAATDSWYVYALSFKQKQTYLDQLGFIIYEIKPLPGDMYSMMPTYDKLRTRPLTPSEKEKIKLDNPGTTDYLSTNEPENAEGPALLERPSGPGEPYFCLHAKSMVIDDELLFIGSYNLDPRSENINTEAGIVIRDKKLAGLLKKSIIKDMAPQNSWIIAKKKMPLGLNHPNAFFVTLSDRFPFLDPWPFRNTASFELIEGKTPVDVTHKDFYNSYRDVGSFPQTDEHSGDKVLGAVGTKTFLSFVKPLL